MTLRSAPDVPANADQLLIPFSFKTPSIFGPMPSMTCRWPLLMLISAQLDCFSALGFSPVSIIFSALGYLPVSSIFSALDGDPSSFCALTSPFQSPFIAKRACCGQSCGFMILYLSPYLSKMTLRSAPDDAANADQLLIPFSFKTCSIFGPMPSMTCR